ncbi:MAG: alpha/beta fold hydrolase BchO [Burkholderiaceae bacterium]
MFDSFYPPMDWDSFKHQWPNSQHSQLIQTQDVRWHIQMFGQGPTILLLHGLGASTHTWRGIAPYLSQHYRLLAVDTPGHAFSSTPHKEAATFDRMVQSLNQMLKSIHIWPDIVIAHSAGAAIAAQLILSQYKMPMPRLIALSPAWLPLTGLTQFLFPVSAKLISFNPLSAWLFAKHMSKEMVIEQILKSTGSKISADDLFFYRTLMQSPAHLRGVLQMMSAWNLGQLPDQLHLLTGPVLIASGECDKTIPIAQARIARHQIINSQLEIFNQLGHLAHEEQPQMCAEKIIHWLNASTTPSQKGH